MGEPVRAVAVLLDAAASLALTFQRRPEAVWPPSACGSSQVLGGVTRCLGTLPIRLPSTGSALPGTYERPLGGAVRRAAAKPWSLASGQRR